MTPQLKRWVQGAVSRGLLPVRFGAYFHYRSQRAGWPDHEPRTFSEKLQYKVYHDRRTLTRVFSDKLAARAYAETMTPGLRSPRILAEGSTPQEVLGAMPPALWVMKATHGSSLILLSTPQSPASAAEVRAKAAAWLATDYALTHWELSYHRLPRRIIFEEFLGEPPDPPNDYKFYVIHGQVRLITVDAGRFTRHVRDAFLPDWMPLRSQVGHNPISEVPPAPPARLGAMIAVAERLAADTDFVRVDLYEYRGTVYFGELTNSPGAGFPHICDARLDRNLGDCWQLPRRYTERMFTPAGRARRAHRAPGRAGGPDALLRAS